MRKATTAIALATLIPDWASTADINGVYKWLDDDAVLPMGILRRQSTQISFGLLRRFANFNGLDFDSRIWRKTKS